MGAAQSVTTPSLLAPSVDGGYQNLHYLLFKAQRLAVSNLELIAVRRVWKAA